MKGCHLRVPFKQPGEVFAAGAAGIGGEEELRFYGFLFIIWYLLLV